MLYRGLDTKVVISAHMTLYFALLVKPARGTVLSLFSNQCSSYCQDMVIQGAWHISIQTHVILQVNPVMDKYPHLHLWIKHVELDELSQSPLVLKITTESTPRYRRPMSCLPFVANGTPKVRCPLRLSSRLLCLSQWWSTIVWAILKAII